MSFLTTIFAPFVALGIMLGGLISPEPQLGASELVPNVVAFFETTLAVGITSTSTDIYLTSATNGDGTTLASSTYAFVIDEGTGNEEIIMADCTGTTCANAIRGISTVDGRTEVPALKQNHRRGASIKITDAPILMLVARALRGEAIVNFTPNEGGDLATKDYVDSVALGGGAVPASLTDDGIVELATGLQAASSTATDQSGSPLTLHTGISTSTAPTSGNYVVVTDTDGNIDGGFLDSADILSVAPFRSSTTVYTTLGTTTYTVSSSDVDVVRVAVQAGGGGGAGGGNDSGGGSGGDGGGGGGGGAYAEAWFDARMIRDTALNVVVGGGGVGGAAGAAYSGTNPGTTGSSSKFHTYVIAPGGGGGGSDGTTAGVGGATSTFAYPTGVIGNSFFFAPGIAGGPHQTGAGCTSGASQGGCGGYGGGTFSATSTANMSVDGATAVDGNLYGGGGQGGAGADNGTNAYTAGGNGRQGYVVVTEIFY